MYIQAPLVVIKPEFILLSKSFLDLDEEGPCCLAEVHSGDKRGWLVRAYKHNKLIKQFRFTSQTDALDMWQEIHMPGFDPSKYYIEPDMDLYWNFAITQSLVSPTGSNQSFSVPDTWGDNTIECIGAGGPGGDGLSQSGGFNSSTGGGGGGGGAYSSISNLRLNRNGTATYRIGAGSTSVAGGDSWFNGTTLAASSVGCKGGGAAVGPANGTGGASASGIGTTKYSGGNGGDGATVIGNAGGGGAGAAGGATANGGTGSSSVTFLGKQGGNSATASGGADIAIGANAGGDGTDFDASHGAGAGGSGGGVNDSTSRQGATGGNYGAGSGGVGANHLGAGTIANTVAGVQGIIFLTWTPFEYIETYS